MIGALTFADIDRLIGFRLGVFDTACPNCGPGRQSPQNRVRKVLRIWRTQSGFASYKCARCNIQGGIREQDLRRRQTIGIGPKPPGVVIAGPWTTTIVADVDHQIRQAIKAAALWGRRQPGEGSPVAAYLRKVRGYGGPLPQIIGYLAPRKPEHHPAMIAAFGVCEEPEPGVVTVSESEVRGVHLTLLKPDGLGKADVWPNKLMVGPSNGMPIVLAPPNDLLGLAIAEGIETALSLHEATGCGVWAAGSAGRMPALADVVPNYLDTVTIAVESDAAGWKGATQLERRLNNRGIHVELRLLGGTAEIAA